MEDRNPGATGCGKHSFNCRLEVFCFRKLPHTRFQILKVKRQMMTATGTPPSAANGATVRTSPLDANISAGPAAKIGMGIFGVVFLVGIIYIGRQLIGDLAEVHSPTIMPYQ